jgi:hypothetical protein
MAQTQYLVNSPVQLVDDIVANIIASTRLPISQITFSNQQIITFLQDEQQTTITQLIKSVREDYWLTNYDTQITTGVYSYTMPPRCAAGALRDFCFVDSSGNEIQVAHLDTDQLKNPNYFAYRPAWQGQGIFLQNDTLNLWPTTFNNSSYKLRQKYDRRPNALTSYGNCSQLVTPNVSANTLTFTGSPPFSMGQYIDLIGITGQFTSQGDNLLIDSVVGAVVTLDSSTPVTSSMTAGSWACPAGLTCVPQMPAEAYPLLLARGMLRIAAALQNSNLFNVASKMAEDAAAKVMSMVTPRVASSPKKFVNKNNIGGPYLGAYYR